MISISRHSRKGERPSILSFLLLTLFMLLLGEKMGFSAEFGMLSNGLEYIIEKREGCGVVAIQIWVKVGSRREDKKIAGITHFIEHLIFKGTERLSANELASKIESMGGSINAFTSYDNTVYHIVIPKEGFEEGFEILAESILRPAFAKEEVEKERRVILEEIKMGEDDPQRRLFKELFLLSYEGHPYGRPIIGFEETVKRIKREEIIKYFASHYKASKMTVVVVGDVEEESVKSMVEKAFKGLKRGKRDGRDKRVIAIKPKQKRKIIDMDIRESYIAISYPIPPLTHKDLPAIEVAGSILGDGESARLKEELKEKRGIVTDIATYVSAQKDGGLFIIYATFQGRDYSKVENAIDELIEKMKKEKVEEWEIRKAKNRLKASQTYARETAQGRAREIGYFYSITKDKEFIEKYMMEVEKVQEREIKENMENYLRKTHRNTVVLLPLNKGNPYVVELKNGLKVLLNRNGYSESFAFRIGFPGGPKEEEYGKNGIFNILSKMLLKGTRKDNARSIAKKIDMLAGEISPFCGRNLFGLSGKFLSKDIEEVLKLLKEILVETVFREDELERVKREVLSEIRQKQDDPISLTFRSFEEVFYDGHPYAKDPSGNEADVKNIGIKDVERYYKEFVGPKYAVLAISGNFDFEALERLIIQIFSSWNGNGRPLRHIPFEPKEKKGPVKIRKDIRQVHVIVGFKGVSLLSEERYTAEVLDALLSGMGGRIYKALREERPYAYAVTFFNKMALDTGEMGIYIGTDIKFVDEVMKIIEKEIEMLKDGNFSEKEVEDAKKFLIGNHLIAMQSNDAISSHLCINTLYGFDPEFLKHWPSRIRNVKKEDLQNLTRKNFSMQKAIKVILGTF